MSFSFGVHSAVNGISVFDWSNAELRETIRRLAQLPEDFDLKYDQMYVASVASGIIVGELAHFEYRVRQIAANQELREWAKAFARNAEMRILGEHLDLS